MKLCASLILLALLMPALPAFAEPDATGVAANSDKSDTSDKSDKSDTSDKAAFDIPVQVGVPIKGLQIPQYDKDGNLVMMFNAEVARKIDETHVEMENLKIEATGDDGKKLHVEMPTAVFDMDTRVLSGNNDVFIRRDDFEITGDAGEFYIKTRFAKILGNVKMIILSTDSFDKP